jgi:MFS family permease
VGFAAAQATQNPICFSLIPELFPQNRTTAMAAYNAAIYAGRALSFAALILAGQLGVPQGVIGDLGVGYTLVPLDKVDLSLVSVLYTQVWVAGWAVPAPAVPA